ncbi:MAG: hypothetical protein LBP38_09265 [Desulfovibrio sp.]|nr:hypothetical protein [Desulfovibrio sp.]
MQGETIRLHAGIIIRQIYVMDNHAGRRFPQLPQPQSISVHNTGVGGMAEKDGTFRNIRLNEQPQFFSKERPQLFDVLNLVASLPLRNLWRSVDNFGKAARNILQAANFFQENRVFF